MSKDTGRQALDWFVWAGSGAEEIELTFTGGEPLLAFPLLQFLVERANDLCSTAGMTPRFVLKTNGTILTEEVISFLAAYSAKTVVSIDGTAESHDKHRLDHSGALTHSSVLGNILKLIKNGIDCVASLTVTPSECDQVLQNVRYLHDMGISHIDVGPAYGTVCWSDAQSAAFSVALMDIAKYVRAETALGSDIEVGPIYKGSEHFGGVLTGVWGCHAGSSNLAFLPDGRIAGCSALAMLTPRIPELVLGDVASGIDESAVEHLINLAQGTIEDRPNCMKCQAADNCTGGCLAIDLAETGRAHTPPSFYCRTISVLPMAINAAWHQEQPITYEASSRQEVGKSLRRGRRRR